MLCPGLCCFFILKEATFSFLPAAVHNQNLAGNHLHEEAWANPLCPSLTPGSFMKPSLCLTSSVNLWLGKAMHSEPSKRGKPTFTSPKSMRQCPISLDLTGYDYYEQLLKKVVNKSCLNCVLIFRS
jgi:hypothetical protein